MNSITQENVRQLLGAITQAFEAHKDELCAFDRAIGDGDHGESMARGTKAGLEAAGALTEGASVYDCFKAYSRAMLASIGGAIGPIFSTVVSELGKAARDSGELGAGEYAAGLKNAADKVMALGGAAPGDKTLVDALVPAAKAAADAGEATLGQIAQAAAKAAGEGVKATIPMQAKMGRSHFLREKSVGHQDAGATSPHLMLQTISDFVNA